MRLALDHHYSTRIAVKLREKGHDVIAANERSWEAETDDALLALCHDERRALLTNNVADFVVLARRWAIEGRAHSGLVFTSDSSMPRSKQNIGRYFQRLDLLLRSLPAQDSLVDRIHWL